MGGGGGGRVNVDIPTDKMNQILQTGLTNALNYSQMYTNSAVTQQQNYYSQALNQLLNSTNQAQSNALNQVGQAQAQLVPYNQAGYQALDKYMDSLTMARPEMGSGKMAQALQNQSNAQSQIGNIQQQLLNLNQMYNLNNPNFDVGNKANAPTLSGLAANATDQQKLDYIKQNTSTYYDPKTNPGGYGTATQVYQGANAQNIVAGPSTAGFKEGGTAVTNPTAIDLQRAPAPSLYYAGGTPGGKQDLVYPDTGAIFFGPQQMMLNNQQFSNAAGIGVAGNEMPTAQNLFNQYLVNYQNLNQFLQNQFTPQQQEIAMAYNQGLFSNPTQKALY